ncbi:hypothetical protein BU24DRAFT_419022 [Aaosphaeria arxii CBS 175.79]|uniref:PWI domain-containing protein n=1 Tax=Aaosphaeria arxii CBS 175.79 TaxID=1450172 RepID=A0A6A5Y2E9_9PLEO|nr:uncharacterized protein BU24DRAFT_419022 [Aaosphaeria arxii CBS 175.79]KAF2019403.1 hypothetical protein BU24DRAFT_419022 [Aaosphaeria arxii CBS 175.79]
MYNNYNASGYNRPPPGYGGPPGMAPPGMVPPPGTAAAPPGVAPPNVNHNQGGPPAAGGPRALPPNWQPPANMPNINFNAPVIRLGTGGPQRGAALDSPSARRESGAPPARRGLGMEGNRDDQGKGRDGLVMLIPPTREEIARTIFVGNIPEGAGGDEGMERILASAGNLRRWTRATDANNKIQTFGFAEYEDAQSLETAAEIFQDVLVPTKRQEPRKPKEENKKDEGDKNEGEKEDGDKDEADKEEEKEIEKTKLQVVVDDASIKYAEDWKARRGDDEETTQFRIDSARKTLSEVLASLFNPPNPLPVDAAGDVAMTDAQAQDGEGVEVVQIAFNAEDELSDIPAEMREMVAAEIAAFRDRSNRRDLERLKREEEIEAEQRRRDNRRASPPASAPTGPGGAGANGVPLGPRAERGIQGAPSGPKGSQFPRDYQGGVNFVNGGALNHGVYINREDEEDSASDSEIEDRRRKKRDDELEEVYNKKLNQWLKYESRAVQTLERTSGRLRNEEAEREKEREVQAKFLENFDDDVEASKKTLLFYRDHGEYMRQRTRNRDREARDDANDRNEENRETAAQNRRNQENSRKADAFLEEAAEEITRSSRENQPFKLSLGAAAKKVEQAEAPRRTVAEVENLLDDEELAEGPTSKKRTIVPINFDASVRANLTQEEIVEHQKQLAKDVPGTKEGLWEWQVSWENLLDKVVDTDIKNWAEKKILELLGMQEDMLVDLIVTHLKAHKGPQELVNELEGVLDDEAEALVKKLWRMVVYYSELEKRGIK